MVLKGHVQKRQFNTVDAAILAKISPFGPNDILRVPKVQLSFRGSVATEESSIESANS